MHQKIEDAIDETDAAVFTGDTFHHNVDDRNQLKDMVRRWWKAINEMEKEDGTDD